MIIPLLLSPLLADGSSTSDYSSPERLLGLIALGLILGATGQGIRAIVGWKQLHDKAAATNTSIQDLFQLQTLLMSFGIGAVAGVCATLAFVASKSQWDMRSVLGIMAAGYAGADFIEGFATQYLPKPADGDKTDKASPKDDHGNKTEKRADPNDDPNRDAAKAEGLESQG